MGEINSRFKSLPNWNGTCGICGRNESQTKFDRATAGLCNTCSHEEWATKNPIQSLATKMRARAKAKSRQKSWPELDFSAAWLCEKLRKGNCEATGIPFVIATKQAASKHARNPWIPSLDRIDSKKPYIKSNVQIVVYMYNACKGQFDHEDVVRFCQKVSEQKNG